MIYKNISESTIMIPNIGEVEAGKTITTDADIVSDVLVRENTQAQPQQLPQEVKPVAPMVNSGAGGNSESVTVLSSGGAN